LIHTLSLEATYFYEKRKTERKMMNVQLACNKIQKKKNQDFTHGHMGSVIIKFVIHQKHIHLYRIYN
jgi:hypothetical protein